MKKILLLKYDRDTNLTRENDTCDIAEYYFKNLDCYYCENLKSIIYKVINKLENTFLRIYIFFKDVEKQS